MAVSSITYNFDSILSTTLMNYRKKLYDNIFNACPFFYWLHANGRKRIEDDDIVDTTPQDNITSCYYNWKEIAGSISISNRELVQNSGKHKIIDRLQAKVNEAEMSMTEEIEAMTLGKITSDQKRVYPKRSHGFRFCRRH